jgi:hypothetical protein
MDVVHGKIIDDPLMLFSARGALSMATKEPLVQRIKVSEQLKDIPIRPYIKLAVLRSTEPKSKTQQYMLGDYKESRWCIIVYQSTYFVRYQSRHLAPYSYAIMFPFSRSRKTLWQYSHSAAIFSAVLLFTAGFLCVLLWTNNIVHTATSESDAATSTFTQFSKECRCTKCISETVLTLYTMNQAPPCPHFT